MNVNHGLLRPLDVPIKKRERGRAYARRSLNDLSVWMHAQGLGRPPESQLLP